MKYSEASMPAADKATKGINTDHLITALLAGVAVAHVISWRLFPALAVTGRLSTSPIVVLLCCIGIASVHERDWRMAKRVSLIAVPVLASGRFTFHILGGAPPMAGLNLFEARCIAELLVLVFISVLCMRHPSEGRDGRMKGIILLGFLTDVLDTPDRPLGRIKDLQLLFSAVALGLWIYGGCRGGWSMLCAILMIPLFLMLMGDLNNKNLIGALLVLKAIADLGATVLLHDQNMFIVFITLDVLAAALALLGKRESYSMTLMMQLMAVTMNLLIVCCSIVDRNSPYFLREAAMWGSEVLIYMSLLLLGFGRHWDNHPISSSMQWMLIIEDDPDEALAGHDAPADAGADEEASDYKASDEPVEKPLYEYRARKAILYLAMIMIVAISAVTGISWRDDSSLVSAAAGAAGPLTWSEDRSVAAHYDIFKETLYGPVSELTYEKRLEFFKAAVDVESNYLCIPYPITVRVDNLDSETSAHFNYQNQAITIDEDYLRECDPWDLTGTAAHEVYHAFQYEACRLDDIVKDERARAFLHDELADVEVYKEELSNYESQGIDYYTQAVEKDARGYAAVSVNSIRERMQELEEAGE